MAIRIGCGSWADDEYVGLLYPQGTPAADRLRVYAQKFDRVELNATYYATPRRETVAGWVKQTPPGFLFDVKLHRAFSQSPANAAAGDFAPRLLDALEPMISEKKLGAFLLTLAPGFSPERRHLDELDGVAEKLRPHLLAMELRHRDWVDEDRLGETLAYFRQHKLVWVALDLPRLDAPSLLPPIDEVTNPRLAYIRLHGRNRKYLAAKSPAERHHYDYPERELAELATRIRSLADKASDVHVSVNNHAETYAPKAALALQAQLGLAGAQNERTR